MNLKPVQKKTTEGAFAKLRTRMVKWIHEVLGVYHAGMYRSAPRTVLIAVRIMDEFVGANPMGFDSFHLVGITSMFIASKLEDVRAMRMTTVQQEVGHGKFPREMIVECERQILLALQFKLPTMTAVDFASGREVQHRPRSIEELEMACYLIHGYSHCFRLMGNDEALARAALFSAKAILERKAILSRFSKVVRALSADSSLANNVNKMFPRSARELETYDLELKQNLGDKRNTETETAVLTQSSITSDPELKQNLGDKRERNTETAALTQSSITSDPTPPKPVTEKRMLPLIDQRLASSTDGSARFIVSKRPVRDIPKRNDTEYIGIC